MNETVGRRPGPDAFPMPDSAVDSAPPCARPLNCRSTLDKSLPRSGGGGGGGCAAVGGGSGATIGGAEVGAKVGVVVDAGAPTTPAPTPPTTPGYDRSRGQMERSCCETWPILVASNVPDSTSVCSYRDGVTTHTTRARHGHAHETWKEGRESINRTCLSSPIHPSIIWMEDTSPDETHLL